MICTLVMGTSTRLRLLTEHDGGELGDDLGAFVAFVPQDLRRIGFAGGVDSHRVGLGVGQQCCAATPARLCSLGASIGDAAVSLCACGVQRGCDQVTCVA